MKLVLYNHRSRQQYRFRMRRMRSVTMPMKWQQKWSIQIANCLFVYSSGQQSTIQGSTVQIVATAAPSSSSKNVALDSAALCAAGDVGLSLPASIGTHKKVKQQIRYSSLIHLVFCWQYQSVCFKRGRKNERQMELVAQREKSFRNVFFSPWTRRGNADKVSLIIDFHARHDRFPQKEPEGGKKHTRSSYHRVNGKRGSEK